MPDVTITISAAIQQAKDAIDQLSKSIDGMAKAADPGAKNAHAGMWQEIFKGSLVAGAARKVWDLFTGGIGDCIKAGIEGADTEAALTAAIDSTGKSAFLNAKHFVDYADKMQGVTTQNDEAVKSAQMLLINLTNLSQSGIDTATRGAIGLSRVMKTDLQTSARVAANAMEGNYMQLSRFIPQLRQASSEGEKHSIVMKFMAAAYLQEVEAAKTTGGQLKQLANWWEELKETIGRAVLENKDVQGALGGVKTAVEKLTKSDDFKLWLNIVVSGAMAVAKEIGKMAKGVSDLISTLAGETKADKELEKAQGTLLAARLRMLAAGHANVFVVEQEKQAANKAAVALAGLEGGTRQLTEAEKKANEEAGKLARTIETDWAKATKSAYESDKIAAQAAYDQKKSDWDKTLKGRAGADAALVQMSQTLNSTLADIEFKHNVQMIAAADEVSAAKRKSWQDDTAKVKEELTRIEAAQKAYSGVMAKFGQTEKAARYKEIQDELNDKLKEINDIKLAGGFVSKDEIDLAKKTAAAKKVILDAEYKGKIESLDLWVVKYGAAMDLSVKMAQKAANLIQGAFANSIQNQTNALETWYQKQKDLINASTMDEKGKADAMTALDQEYEDKKLALKKKAFQQQKELSIINAIIDTASAVISALSTKPFIPLGIIAASMATAMGLIEIGIIKGQQMPLARGGILDRPTFSGRAIAGESGPELVAPLGSFIKDLAGAIAKAVGGGGSAGGGGSIILDGERVGKFVTKRVQRSSDLRELQFSAGSLR